MGVFGIRKHPLRIAGRQTRHSEKCLSSVAVLSVAYTRARFRSRHHAKCFPALILGVLIACALVMAGAPPTAYAADMPPEPKLVDTYNLGGGYSDAPTISCLTKDGRYAAVESSNGEYAITYIVNLETGERRRLPDVDYGYIFYPLDGSRALAESIDGLMLCDFSTSELESLSIDASAKSIVSCQPLDDGRNVRLVTTDSMGSYTCSIFDVDAQTVTKQVALQIPDAVNFFIADDASHIFVISSSDEAEYYCSTYDFDDAIPEQSVSISGSDEAFLSFFMLDQIDASTVEVTGFSSSSFKPEYMLLDTTTGELDPVLNTAAGWLMTGEATLFALVDPAQPYGDTVSADALGRLEMRSVDLKTGETRYQCQVPAALYHCTLQITALSQDGRYLYAPNDYGTASKGISSMSVIDISSGAVTNLPLALADGSTLQAMRLSDDNSKLVLLTVDDTDGSMNMALSVYDTGIGVNPVTAFLANTPVLIIIGVAALVVVVLVVGVLIFIGRRRRVSAPAFCPQCGSRIEESGAAFCPHCGAPLRR